MVSIIACTIRDQMMENILRNYERQLWKDKELIIILNNDSMIIESWKEYTKEHENVTVYQLPEEKTLGECLNFGIERAKYDVIAKFDDDDYYSPYYFSEAMIALKNSNAQLIGKGVSFMYFEKDKLLMLRNLGNENKMGKSGLKGGTLIFKKEIYPKIKFPSRSGAGTDSHFVKACKRNNISIYSTSRYNYVYIRRGNKNSHTYNLPNSRLRKRSTFIKETDNFKDIVTKVF